MTQYLASSLLFSAILFSVSPAFAQEVNPLAGAAETEALAERYCKQQPERCEEIKASLEKIRQTCIKNPLACKMFMEKRREEQKAKAEVKQERREKLIKMLRERAEATKLPIETQNQTGASTESP